MKIIFNARDIIEAHIVSGMLNANGIETYIGGYYLQGGIGEACGFNFANIQINDSDYAAALPLVAKYETTSINNSETDIVNIAGTCTAS